MRRKFEARMSRRLTQTAHATPTRHASCAHHAPHDAARLTHGTRGTTQGGLGASNRTPPDVALHYARHIEAAPRSHPTAQPKQTGTGGRFARAPSALYSRPLHHWSEPCKRGVTDKERITQGTMHTAKRNDKGYYRGTRYCLSRKIFEKILETQ